MEAVLLKKGQAPSPQKGGRTPSLVPIQQLIMRAYLGIPAYPTIASESFFPTLNA